jgi:hypothetical protein
MNRKNILIIIGLFISISVSLMSCKSGNKDKVVTNDTTGKKTVVTAPKLLDYSLPKEFKYTKKDREHIYDEFYPIGYSKNGLFAYMTLPADEATGYFFYTFVILDLNTNQTIWSQKVDYNDHIEKGSLKETWTTNYLKFKEQLNKNSIIEDKKLKINKFPSADAENLNLLFDIKYVEDSFGFGFNVVAKVSAKIKGKTIPAKQIYEKTYNESMILNVMSPGYIQIPETNFVVCFINTEQRGYEGPPHVILLDLKGIKLK